MLLLILVVFLLLLICLNRPISTLSSSHCDNGESHQPQDSTSFLRVKYNVNPEFSKVITVDLFEEFGYSVGILFHKHGKWVLIDQAQFLKLQEEVHSISNSLCNKGNQKRFETVLRKSYVSHI